MSGKSVAIDCIAESKKCYGKDCAVVVIDVIRSITVAATAINSGRRCYFAPTVEEALLIAKKLEKPLLVGEIGGNMPYGFDVNNSPVDIENRKDVSRPIVLVSSSGMPLLHSLRNCHSVFVACLRNYGTTIAHLAERYKRVEILGAPTRGEFREEDKLCCAWIADGLMKTGFAPEGEKTIELINLWKDKPVEVCAEGKSAEYLRKTNQTKDLDFVLRHVNDLDMALLIVKDEIVRTSD